MARQYWLSTGGVLLVLMLAMLSGYHYYESRGQALKKIDQRLFAGATALRYSVGDTLHNQWLNPQSSLSEQQRHDAAIRLTQLCNDLKLKDLYTLVKHDGGLYFTISSLTAEELAAEHYPSDFEIYEDAGPDDYAAYDGTEPRYFESEDRWGSFRSVLIPCVTESGYRYLAGADVDVDVVNRAMAETLNQTFIQFMVLLLAAMPVTMLFVALLRHQLYTDELTGLPNRDKLLVRVASCLKSLVPAGARLYRLSGDEYALLCESAPRCVSVDYLILRINAQRFEIDGTEFRLSVTAGVAQGPYKIIEHADLALKEAKRVLKPFKFYSPRLHTAQNSHANLLWTYKLKDAIEGQRLLAYFQPIHDNCTGVVSHYESLIRMREEDGTVVSPDCFMEAARKSRVYGHLTLFMIDAALRCIEQSGVACTVNLSIEDIIGENRSRSPSAKPIFKHLHPLRRESVRFDPRFTKLYLSYTRLNHRLTSELLELYGIQRKAHLML